MAQYFCDVCSIYSDDEEPVKETPKEPPKITEKIDFDYSQYNPDACSILTEDNKPEIKPIEQPKPVEFDYSQYSPDACSAYSVDKPEEKPKEQRKPVEFDYSQYSPDACSAYSVDQPEEKPKEQRKPVEFDYSQYSPDACSAYSDDKPEEKPKEQQKPVEFDYSQYSPDACSIYSEEKPKEERKAVEFDYSQYSPDACSIYSEEKPKEQPKPVEFDYSHYSPDACSVYSEDKPEEKPKTPPSPSGSSLTDEKKALQSMLVTGFGLRNLESLQRALLDDEQRRQMLLAQHDIGESYECEDLPLSSSSKVIAETVSKTSVTLQEPDVASRKSLSLEYLMGLAQEQETYEEFAEKEEKVPSFAERSESVDSRITTAMRQARRYLYDHNIFQFFQFLMAHMCSQIPDNPIEFLLDLLDRCLLYRSGFGQPPLLFEKPHIEQLFKMMDPMKTGFIEMKQYESGMKTLGICNYDKHPPLSTDGLISKDFFVEEAYECLTDLFVDMVRHRNFGSMISLVTPPPTIAIPSMTGYGQ